MPVAQLSLPKRPTLIVGISGESSRTSAAAANGALCRISAREQLNFRCHSGPILRAAASSNDDPGGLTLCVYQQIVNREPAHPLSDSCCAKKNPLAVFIIAIQTALGVHRQARDLNGQRHLFAAHRVGDRAALGMCRLVRRLFIFGFEIDFNNFQRLALDWL
jgi:hypothetical protein